MQNVSHPMVTNKKRSVGGKTSAAELLKARKQEPNALASDIKSNDTQKSEDRYGLKLDCFEIEPAGRIGRALT
jgi:hypothetical protein